MKLLIGNNGYTSYTFSPSTRQITLAGISGLRLEQFLLITNVTSNTIIYNFADPQLGGSLVGNTLTLDYNTSTMGANDNLQIFVDIEDEVTDILHILKRIAKLVEPLSTQDVAQRQRVVVDSAVLSSGTVSNVANLAAVAGIDPRFFEIEWARQSYNNGIRSNLSWS